MGGEVGGQSTLVIRGSNGGNGRLGVSQMGFDRGLNKTGVLCLG